MDGGTKGRRSGLLRNLRESKPVTYVELFFDLVFVFALFRISRSLLQAVTWVNAYRILIMLLAVWSVWLYTNLLTDSLEPRTIRLQLLVIGSMFGALLMSAAIPEAYTERGLLFALVYVVINLGRSSFVAFALRNDDLGLRPLRAAFWFVISAGPWLAGAEVEGGARVALWSVAVAIDYIAAFLRWPAPRIGPTPARLLNLASEHFAERYRQFIIIALGETVVAIGTNLHDRDFSMERGVAFTVSFIVTGLLFWIYFHRVREKLGPVFAGAPDPGVRNREAGIAHLLMVIGLVAVTTSSEMVITEPARMAPASWAAVIVGGPSLFLAGHALLARPAFARVAVPRLVGAGLLIAAGAALVGLPVLAVVGAVAAVLVGVVIWDLTHSGTKPGDQALPRRV